MKHFLLACILISFFSCNTTRKDSKLIEVFKASNTQLPHVSVHRGGKGLAFYPENCLETIQYVNDSISAIYEIDVAQTKDSVLVLMHDNAIDRTSTGTGLVKNLTYESLKSFNLVDDYGNKTAYKIPLFKDVLSWCKANNVVLTIDVKGSVSQEVVINAIRAVKAEDVCILITYDVQQAKSAYNLAPDLLLSVSARNETEFNNLLDANIPTKNMLAFTGTRLSNVTLYEKLHSQNIVCMLGTLGNLDQQAKTKNDTSYKIWQDLGVDIFATDRPFAVYNSIN
ncbi:glycerophosphodiester phosphodiesterase family protein [Formosa sediminum]|uniref:Glycerophosphodiester phosphodiesterase family protein n=1 Tax=Formosa sediminum TaxID=2594004 RepID=A0A516GVB3_9FLAO|nr:glycerophosphodiester phosphodiesterase family protein [Formosa sediminum]QDO95330.1 glycerophosphodiester phosphodiesterase family protein [Formosa sediminum]